MLALKVFKTMRIHTHLKGPLVLHMVGTRLLSELCNCGFPHSSQKLCERIHIFHSACPGHLQLASGYQLVGEEALWSVCGIGTSAGKMCAACGGEKKKRRGASEAFSHHHIMWQWTTFLRSLSTRKKKKRCETLPIFHRNLRATAASVPQNFFPPCLLNNDVLGWNAYKAPGEPSMLSRTIVDYFQKDLAQVLVGSFRLSRSTLSSFAGSNTRAA